MLGQRSTSEEAGPTQHAMSPAAFFFHYPALQPFLLGELRGSAQDLEGPPNEAKLHLKPSLYPILTLLAQLQPGVQDSAECVMFTFLLNSLIISKIETLQWLYNVTEDQRFKEGILGNFHIWFFA